MSIVGVTPKSIIHRKPNYGIDSPGIILGEAAIGTIALVCAIFFPRIFGHNLRWLEIAIAVEFLALAASMLAYSKSGKMAIRDAILGSIPWRGDERVLDAGCGRGLLLIGAARCVPQGSSVGIDKWVRGALTGNGAEAVLRNAEAEGVAARIEVTEGDVRRLPFPDGAFDVVVSNFVVHEVDTRQDREQMMSEMMRVLRSGGRLALVDFIFTGECVEILRQLDMHNVRRARIGGLSTWLGTVLMFGTFRIHLVTGSKVSLN
jgi:SAM-dependent methyltransferase